MLGVGARGGPPGARLGRRSAGAAVVVHQRVLPRRRPRRRAGVVARSRASAPAPPVAAGRAPAASTTVARCGKAAVWCGNAIASTKCSWKRGSTAVSIFSTRRTTPSISRRAAPRQQRDERAGPGRVAGRADVVEVAVGDRARGPSRGAGRSGCRRRRPAGSRRPSSIPSWSISSRTPAYSAALASWIARTSFWVMAIRGPPSSAVVEDVAERAAVGDDARRARRRARRR